MYNNKVGIIIQARMSSTRFPGKMLQNIGGTPLIQFLYNRCMASACGKVIVATSEDVSDNVLSEYCMSNNIPVIRGPLEDVLSRYIIAAESIDVQYLVRVCGDEPFVDIDLIGKGINMLVSEHLDYVFTDPKKCASCFLVETVTLDALKTVQAGSPDHSDREHVTKYIVGHNDDFQVKVLDDCGYSLGTEETKLVVDEPRDLAMVSMVVDRLEDKTKFTSQDVINALKSISCKERRVVA
jgi:spore coat polysaccharide biosynthesis protein SpsF